MSNQMNNTELQSILPDINGLLHKMMDSKDFNDYENKLDTVTRKAINELERIIDDQTLALDPEQLVNAVKVLAKSKSDIIESKRKLLDTCIKGEVMIKALDNNKDKGGKGSSVLLDYLEKNNLNTTLDTTGTSPGAATSIFQSIEQDNEKE